MLTLKQELKIRLINNLILAVAVVCIGAFWIQPILDRIRAKNELKNEAAQIAVQGLGEISGKLAQIDDIGSRISAFFDAAFKKAEATHPKSEQEWRAALGYDMIYSDKGGFQFVSTTNGPPVLTSSPDGGVRAAVTSDIQKLFDELSDARDELKTACDHYRFWMTDKMYDDFTSYPDRLHQMNLAAIRGNLSEYVKLRDDFDQNWPTVDKYLEPLK